MVLDTTNVKNGGDGTLLGTGMTLPNAFIFIDAYIQKYYMEELSLTIQEMPKPSTKSA